MTALAPLLMLGQDADTPQQVMLAAHNSLRAQVGAPPFVWSPELESVARRWAERLIDSGQFAHTPRNSHGENLFESEGRAIPPGQVVEYWASEGKSYDYARNACRAGAVCGHYTQIVWARSRKLGCGSARKGRREVWVCEYDPPGNYAGQKPY